MDLYDLSLFNAMSLRFAFIEFCQRYKTSEKKTKFYGKDSQMPLISSECPGWVCYAEKRCGQLALPHMSNVKSA